MILRTKTEAALPDTGTQPHTIRLPAEGKTDPIFGCPRQKYLQLEREGILKLIRLVPKGKQRGTVLIPVAAMWKHLESLERTEAAL
jgi:hypothetical protein